MTGAKKKHVPAAPSALRTSVCVMTAIAKQGAQHKLALRSPRGLGTSSTEHEPVVLAGATGAAQFLTIRAFVDEAWTGDDAPENGKQ